MKRQPNTKKLVDHVSRLEGQLASIKEELKGESPDCLKVSRTLHSASRSFAGLREQCMENFLLAHFVDETKVTNKALFEQLLTLTKG